MSPPYALSSGNGLEIDSESGSDTEEMYVDKNGVHFQILRQQAGNRDEIPHRESCQHVVCRECSHEFRTVEALELHSKQVHKPKLATARSCPDCYVVFGSISAVTQHIESRQCQGKIAAADFCNSINDENTSLAGKNFPAYIPSGTTTTTHTWRAGNLPPHVDAGLADTSGCFKPEEPFPKDFVGILDHTPPAKPASSPMETSGRYLNKVRSSHVCPRPGCRKKFRRATGLKAHLESAAHEKKSFRCPTCFSSFVSCSGLLQHAESEACGVKRSPAYKQLVGGATGELVNGDNGTGIKTVWQKPSQK